MKTRIEMGDDEDAEVQMGPLIDCVFLLLIFFLVASVLKKPHQEIPVVQPHLSGVVAPKKPASVAVIQVSAARNVYLNGELMVRNMADVMETDFFLKRMKDLASTEPRPRIRVDVERASTYQDLMFVTDTCYKAGFSQVGTHIWGGKLP